MFLLHFWDSLPKFIRVICYWTVGLFTLLGLLIGLKNPTALMLSVLIFIGVGIICSAITVGAYYFVVMGSRKATEQKISSVYAQKGYCAELAQLSEQVFIMGDLRLKLQRVFFYLMSEDYDNAEKYVRVLVDEHGTQRETAMLNTARMWLFAMTGRIERAETLFQENEKKQNQAYEMMRDLKPEYQPQLDDAIVYFLLASAFSLRLNEGARLNDYRSAFLFQVSKRSQADQMMYPKIYDLVLLYASNRFEEASAMEHSLLAEIQTSGTDIPYARRDDLTRMVNQARIFAKYVEVVKSIKESRPTVDEQIGQIEGLSTL